MKLQAISHSIEPDGFITRYLFGMPKPELKDLSPIMKIAAFNHVQDLRPKVNQERILNLISL